MASTKKQNSSIKFILILIIFCFIVYFLKDHYQNRDGILEINGVDKIYLAVNEIKQLNVDVVKKDKGITKINYESSNDNVASIDDNGFITAHDVGQTNIKISSVSGVEKIIEIIVSDLISLPIYSQEKEELLCNIYSSLEAQTLDGILKNDIDNAGYGTRAGVVAAARFLSLRFPYKINYFFENGRLAGTDRNYVDGEGRYYHIGLYLSEDKYGLLEENATSKNPAMWGCDLYATYVNTYSRNGLNCSGFISWAMLNGGFDVGDIGAGITDQHDFTDIGEKNNITLDLMSSNKVKVGDLIGRNGHIAIIIGMSNDKIYIAESYMPNMKVREFSYEELIQSDDFKYIMLMDTVYKNDGNLTNMW